MEAFEMDVSAAPDAATVHALTELVDRATSALGHDALSEHKRRQLSQLARTAPPVGGNARLGVPPGPAEEAFVVVARRQSGSEVVGYAHVSEDPPIRPRLFATELVTEPGGGSVDRGLPQLADDLLDAVVRVVAAKGGGTLRLWTSKAGVDDDARAMVHGFRRERDLIQMRCPLPLPPTSEASGHGPTIETRPFRPGQDEQAWLATNNRAFADHPEQGHWELETLLAREQEPWFDPEGLLLLEHGGRLAGSCWTKVHRDTDPPMGEIYVIGVDPEFHGRGWGRALTRAGLERLASQGLTVGMLYVDEGNRAAVAMYQSMGFVADHVDRAYTRDVPFA